MALAALIIIIAIILILVFGWQTFVEIVEQIVSFSFEIIDVGIQKAKDI